MLHWIWVLIVGGLIGMVAGAILYRGGVMSWISNIIAGLVGASFGQWLFGAWGPQLAGMAVVPALIGAVIVVLSVSMVLGIWKKDDADPA